MRRSLVLTDEQRRNRYLASLPRHVRDPEAPLGPGMLPYWRLRLAPADWREIFAVYCVVFVAVSIFIA